MARCSVKGYSAIVLLFSDWQIPVNRKILEVMFLWIEVLLQPLVMGIFISGTASIQNNQLCNSGRIFPAPGWF